jgi:hypothetical protein
MLERVRHFTSNEKTIVIADYSDLKEDDMLKVLAHLVKVVVDLNIPVRIISRYNARCYITQRFMRQVEASTKLAMHLIEDQAVVGLTPIKKLILKGYNFMFNFSIQNFDTEEEAIQHLLTKR